jgi:hypothetical protein
MKSGLYLKLGIGLALGLAPFLGASRQATTNPAPPSIEAGTNAPADTTVTPVAGEKPVPSNIKPSTPTSEVIRLANSAVSESVLLAYVTNSTSTFNLGAEQIIYLNDIGVPSGVVTAMIQHDQGLKEASSAAMVAANPQTQTPQPMQEPPPVPANEPPPPAEGQPEPVPAPVEAPLTPPETTSDFYGTLAPYGSWVNVDGYGTCWQPTVVVVNAGWQPYCNNGHWIYTDCGWYWCSDYSWGWAPFHYGRWFCHHQLGWCWAPDTVWGPSWVSWRHSDAYCGWAPLPPGCAYSLSAGLTFHGHHVQDGDDCGLDHHHYCFVSWHDFHDHHLQAHTLPRDQAARAFNHSTVANRFTTRNNLVVNQGVPATRVAAATQTPLHPLALQTTSAPRVTNGRLEQFDPNRRTLTVYRPTMSRPAQSTGTMAQNTPTGITSGATLEKAPWRPVSPPANQPTVPGQAQLAGGGQVHSGAHLAPGLPTGQPPVPAQSVPRAPVSPQNPTTITLKGPQSPVNPSRPVWNPYTQNPTPWQNTTPATRGTVNPPAQTAMIVPQAPAQTQWQGPYSGQYNQASGYQAPYYQAPNYQTPNYQTTARSGQAEVPRYNNNNTYSQSRTYSPAANNSYQGNQSAPTYQAPAQHYAQPAPSAAPARTAANPAPQQQQQQSSRGGDTSTSSGRGR